jgi:hypothetical protein
MPKHLPSLSLRKIRSCNELWIFTIGQKNTVGLRPGVDPHIRREEKVGELGGVGVRQSKSFTYSVQSLAKIRIINEEVNFVNWTALPRYLPPLSIAEK